MKILGSLWSGDPACTLSPAVSLLCIGTNQKSWLRITQSTEEQQGDFILREGGYHLYNSLKECVRLK